MKAFDILNISYGKSIAKNIFNAYKEIGENYVLEKWKPSELDAGHFVESVRRLLEFELTGTHTPFKKKLPLFNDKALTFYENQSGHESYRLLIPRVLKSIYNLRNKRGVAHITDISPNEMDATIILYSVKWILAEIVRLNSKLSIEETQSMIDSIIEREIPLIFKDKNITKVLNVKIRAKDQVLLLLFDNSPQKIENLRASIEYSNRSGFNAIIKNLHKLKLIHCSKDQKCLILPPGLNAAEEIIKSFS